MWYEELHVNPVYYFSFNNCHSINQGGNQDQDQVQDQRQDQDQVQDQVL